MEDDAVGGELLAVSGRGIQILAALFVLMRWVIPPLLGHLARNRELLVLFAVAWADAVAAVGDNLELSAEVNES